MVYPAGSRDETAAKRFDTPCDVNFQPVDWFSFNIGAVVDAEDDDLKRLADALAEHPRMRDLQLGGCQRVSDRGLRHISKFIGLEILSMTGFEGVSSRGWDLLERFQSLI